MKLLTSNPKYMDKDDSDSEEEQNSKRNIQDRENTQQNMTIE